jgi:alkanesulfonate monooxygenase SsuD/methylene tetrahydromethanopterin reductase-like flavin-dependent oxidoreductase (luciferase family)
MEFGLQFFPDVGPDEKSPRDYWKECLHLAELADRLGLHHVRTVEHYFHRYGGYSPSPIVFLSAASQRTRRMRLITGAVLPIFNHPLKVAAEIGMLDAMSDGRLEVGFARAFLPHEFHRFGRSMDESRSRFNEGVEQIRVLLEEENVTYRGQFHSFENITSLPRPTQKPRPPFWIATTASAESQVNAANGGHSIMTVPISPEVVRANFIRYREAFAKAGHKHKPRTMVAVHLYCEENNRRALDYTAPMIDAYFESMREANEGYLDVKSKDYPGYQHMLKALREGTFETRLAEGAVWCGDPKHLIEQIEEFDDAVGGVDYASIQVNFHTMELARAEANLRLFAEEVMPHFQKQKVA